MDTSRNIRGGGGGGGGGGGANQVASIRLLVVTGNLSSLNFFALKFRQYLAYITGTNHA